MRAIKVLVVVMGILIIIGTVFLGMKLAERMGNKEGDSNPPLTLNLPQGAHIRDLQTLEGQILLRLAFPPGKHEEVWIVNAKKGDVIKKIVTE